MMTLPAFEKKSGPPNAPPVWAETRQELAESLTYFRAYQSGSYTVSSLCKHPELRHRAHDVQTSISDPTSYAYLLGGFGSARDAWAAGGKVVISHGGGHAQTTNPTDAGSASCLPPLASSQSRYDARVAALLSCQAKRTPIILILGENYPLTDFNLNCAFAVLGWYAVTTCWAEKEDNGMVRWKARFEWLHSQGHPWWLPAESHGTDGVTSKRQTGRQAPEWNPRKKIEVVSSSSLRPSLIAASEAEMKTHKLESRQIHRRLDAKIRVAQRLRQRDALRKRPLQKQRELMPSSLSKDDWCRPYKEGEGSQTCSHCNVASPQVYSAAWTCLEPECYPGFWRLTGSLDFSERFLRPMPTDLAGIQIPFPVQPLSFQESHEARGVALQQPDGPLKGLFCGRCHRLSCREHFTLQRCAHCHYTIIPPSIAAQSPSYTTRSHILLHDTHINSRFNLINSHRIEGPFDVISWTLPEPFLGAKIHVVQHRGDASPDTSSDEILAAMQQTLPPKTLSGSHLSDDSLDDLLSGGLKLRRHELSMHRSCASGSKGRLLTQMFTQNLGEQYKHSTATKTIPLDQAPQSMVLAKEVLTRRTKLVTSLAEPFNELYPCAYLRGMKMNFHDDGEPGLGPVVSSLSLGNVPAQMTFRLKRKFAQIEASLLCKDDQGQDLPQKPSSRLSHSCSGRTILSAYKAAQLDAVRDFGIPQHDRTMLSIPLRHGTLVVQEGEALQECFEHAVVPQWQESSNSNGVRFAITARRID